MTKDLLGVRGLFGGALLAGLVAALLPACGSSGSSGVGGRGGSIGGTGTGGTVGLCSPELVPNETRDSATPYVLDVPIIACIGTETDIDTYSFTIPPNNPAGGFVRLTFTEVGITGSLDVKLFSAADNSEINEIYKIDTGASIDGYLAVAAGATYRLAVTQFGATGFPFSYKMTATYTGVVDLFEPNDTKATAKAIGVGTAITAYQAAGYVSDPYLGEAYGDWYSVVLKAGAAVIKMSTVPTDIMGDVTLFDPEGVSVGEMYSTTPGANVTLMTEVEAAGTYTISVVPFAGAPMAAGEVIAATPPDHFTRPYTLLVTQP